MVGGRASDSVQVLGSGVDGVGVPGVLLELVESEKPLKSGDRSASVRLAEVLKQLLSERDVPGETCSEVEGPLLEEGVLPSGLLFWRSERCSSKGMILETGLSYTPF